MFRSLIVIVCGLSAVGVLFAQKPPQIPPQEGKSADFMLFNGKSLDGWIFSKENWGVVNDEIVGKSRGGRKVSTYLISKSVFSDFRLAFSIKTGDQTTDSGVGFWGEAAPTRGDPFAYKGLQITAAPRWGVYDSFGRAWLMKINDPARKAANNDWNDVELFAQGNRVRVVLNGVLATDWREPMVDRIKPGPIAIRLPAGVAPQEVRVRGLKLTTFPDDERLKNKGIGDAVQPPKD